MSDSRHRRCLVALATFLTLMMTVAAEPEAAPASDPTHVSATTAVVVDRTEELGTFAGVAFERLVGHVEGRAHRSEPVAGLGDVIGDGEYHVWRSEFEVIRPAGDPGDVAAPVAVVEVENRGSPLMLPLLNRFVMGFPGAPSKTAYPEGLGDAFLFSGRRAYARVQWQTGISPGVPETAQGVGEVIVRDFGRLLRSGRLAGGGVSPLGRYPTLLLTGISQSAWFIDTFLAEGFNRDPAGDGGVFDGALTVAGAGNWLGINQLADDGQPQAAYVRANGRPLPAGEILTRPDSDPFLVDIVTYTDFYRLRAALAREPDPPPRSRRYELPAPHAPGFLFDETFVFETLGCNGGEDVPLSPLDPRPYLRALFIGLEATLDGGNGDNDDNDDAGERRLSDADLRLPPSAVFTLGGEPAPSSGFNDLPGAEVRVPHVDRDGQPEGGVRFPEADLPLGRLEPPALSPATTESATAICGNFGGYRPFTASELATRYGTADDYEESARTLIDRLVRQGFLLTGDRAWVTGDLRSRFETAAH